MSTRKRDANHLDTASQRKKKQKLSVTEPAIAIALNRDTLGYIMRFLTPDLDMSSVIRVSKYMMQFGIESTFYHIYPCAPRDVLAKLSLYRIRDVFYPLPDMPFQWKTAYITEVYLSIEKPGELVSVPCECRRPFDGTLPNTLGASELYGTLTEELCIDVVRFKSRDPSCAKAVWKIDLPSPDTDIEVEVIALTPCGEYRTYHRRGLLSARSNWKNGNNRLETEPDFTRLPSDQYIISTGSHRNGLGFPFSVCFVVHL